jgi:hypothetical protein
LTKKEGGRKLDMLVQANLTSYQAVKVAGPQGEFWQPVTPEDYEDIPAEYQYSVDVGSITPQLPEIERAQFIGWMGALMQAPYLMQSKRLMTILGQSLTLTADRRASFPTRQIS